MAVSQGDKWERRTATRNAIVRGRDLGDATMKRVMILALAAVLGTLASNASAQTLATIKQRGVLNCGANGTLAGFGLPDAQGRWTGLDVDFCRALAAAIFN